MNKGSDISTININRHEKMDAFMSKSLPTNSNRWLLSKQHYGMSANQVGQSGNQYSSALTNMSCSNCGGSGHSSAQCLNIRNVPGQPVGGAYANRVSAGSGMAPGECFKCHQEGHWAKNCPGISAAPPAYGSNNVMQGGYRIA